jgi:hypothetical protein
VSEVTQRTPCDFHVSIYESGQPFIVCGHNSKDVPLLQRSLLSFDLPKGTSIEEAREIARYMSEHITHVALTEWEDGKIISKLN